MQYSLCKRLQTIDNIIHAADWVNNECMPWNCNLLLVLALRFSGGSGCPSGPRLCDPWHGERHRGGDPLPSGWRKHSVRARFPPRSIHRGPEESRTGWTKVSRVIMWDFICQWTNWLIGGYRVWVKKRKCVIWGVTASSNCLLTYDAQTLCQEKPNYTTSLTSRNLNPRSTCWLFLGVAKLVH